MTFAKLGGIGLDYEPCRYAGSRVTFRGPRRALRGNFIAFLGGTDTFGRCIEAPFPTQIEDLLKTPVVNLGAINAGLDLYVKEPALIDICNNATVTVMQVMGAQNLSNRFYSVHPRRNDRFVKASDTLHAIYPEVDFADVHFTRHLLQKLVEVSTERFDTVRTELQTAWLARMKLVLSQIRGPVVLLWLADQPPTSTEDTPLDLNPLFVTADMLDALGERVTRTLEVRPSTRARAAGTEGMMIGAQDVEAISKQLNAAAHAEITDALAPLLQDVLAFDARPD